MKVNALYRTLGPEGSTTAQPGWLTKLREAGRKQFETVGFPSPKDEEWRFTNFAPIRNTHFVPAEDGVDRAGELVAKFSFGEEAIVELVFVNGRFAPSLSRLNDLPRGARVSTLAAESGELSTHLAADLGRFAAMDLNPFVALNTAALDDAAIIELPNHTTVEQPIHILHVCVGEVGETIAQPRVLFVAGANVEATLVESYVGDDRVYFINAVTEIAIGADSRIDHCKLQQEGPASYHVASTAVHLQRNARFVSHSASIGSLMTRNTLGVVMAGEYADATLNGLVLASGAQQIDNHTTLDHASPNCPSHELYKHVLSDRARAVFKGKILVRKDAQKTDSKQTSKALLLSDDALMQSQPALEIYADDVKCTHGSTTGPVDEEQVFYMRSRGISLEASRHLMTYAFAADITRRIRVEAVRNRIESYMAQQHNLPQDLRITHLGHADEAVVNL
jgi:Fe-S cluster assembly protein SufD